MNKNNTSQIRLEQFNCDSESWKRSLRFLAEENIHLKNRLMQVLKHELDKNAVGEMENFHNKFLQQDELISLLRNTLADIDTLLLNINTYSKVEIDRIKLRLVVLGNDVLSAADQLYKVRISFNGYLMDNL